MERITVGIDGSQNTIKVDEGEPIDNKKKSVIQFMELVIVTITGFGLIISQLEDIAPFSTGLLWCSFGILTFILVVCALALFSMGGMRLYIGSDRGGLKIRNVNVGRWIYFNIDRIIYTLYAISTVTFFIGFLTVFIV